MDRPSTDSLRPRRTLTTTTMHLVLDIGSTEISAGAFVGDELRASWRLRSDPLRTPDEWRVYVTGLIGASRLEPAKVEKVSSASVAPAVAASLLEAVRTAFAVDPYSVDWRSPLPIRIDLDDPTTVGADRLANAIAAHRLHPGDAIVVDLGTATTYDCVTADGAFVGGAIAPGARTAAEHLITRATRLPAVGLAVPQRVIGRHTTAALESGIFFAATDAVEGMVTRIRTEWGKPHATVIATGGLAPIVGPHCASVDHIDPNLTLVGIRLAREHLDSGGRG